MIASALGATFGIIIAFVFCLALLALALFGLAWVLNLMWQHRPHFEGLTLPTPARGRRAAR